MYWFLIPLLLGFVLAGASAFTSVYSRRLEEIDLLQRIPEYREYMKQVPRFLPRLRRKKMRLKGVTVN